MVLVVLESTLALGVLGQPAERYLAGYDILAGALFPYGLTVMALAPVVLRPPAG